MKEKKEEPLKILYLDDNQWDLEKFKMMIDDYPHLFIDLKVTHLIDKYQSLLKSLQIHSWSPDIIILDYELGDSQIKGHQLIKGSLDIFPDATYFIYTTHDKSEVVTQSMIAGADEIISKKFSSGQLLKRLLETHKFVQSKKRPFYNNTSAIKNESFVYEFYAGKTLHEISLRIPSIQRSAIRSILIYGETGTGKEVVARLFKNYIGSDPFITYNCGGTPSQLVIGELFGHTKGAFTGAHQEKEGLLSLAAGGWVYLDEIQTLSDEAQAALLRFLESGEIKKIGEKKVKHIQVRILAATNINLEDYVSKGLFRKDLWQRIQESTIILPELNDRREEIPDICLFLLKEMKKYTGIDYKLTEEALHVLLNADWQQGNIRALRNCLRSMTEFHISGWLGPLSFSQQFLLYNQHNQQISSPSSFQAPKQVTIEENTKIILDWDLEQRKEEPIAFTDLCDRLLSQMLQKIIKKKQELPSFIQESYHPSLRDLSQILGIPKSTLALKIKRLQQLKLISSKELEELNQCYYTKKTVI